MYQLKTASAAFAYRKYRKMSGNGRNCYFANALMTEVTNETNQEQKKKLKMIMNEITKGIQTKGKNIERLEWRERERETRRNINLTITE